MKKLINIVLSFMIYLACSCSPLMASSTTEHFSLHHADIAEPLAFNVQLPSGYEVNKEKSYVLMFNFHHYSNTYLSGLHDWMSHNGEWPWLETIIVTPARGNKSGLLFDATGKTTPLLDFFETQLIPHIDKTYRTNKFRIISGFRVDGSVVLSSLLNKPYLFNAYIAVSPELKNDMAAILSTSKNKIAKLQDKPRFLMFSHGENVKEEHQYALYEKLHQILNENAPKQLDWHYKKFGQHYFMSLPILSVVLGIEKLFDDIHVGLHPTSDISQQGVDAIIKHYQHLSSDKYGFEVSPKRSINSLAKHLMTQSENDGLAILKEMIKRYPNDAYAFHNLANAYAELGKYTQAVKYQKIAAELSDSMLTWHQKRHHRFLAEYQDKLAAAVQLGNH